VIPEYGRDCKNKDEASTLVCKNKKAVYLANGDPCEQAF